MRRLKTYQSVGRCIYCDVDGVELGDEHIIAESLGGMLILPKASCAECARAINQYEQPNARNLFCPIRRQQGFPSKNRGRKDKARRAAETFTVTIDGKRIRVPANLLPGLLISFAFPPADALSGVPPRGSFAGRAQLTTLPGFDERVAAIARSYGKSGRSVSVDVNGEAELVGRMLAKIAHAYAVAELGLGTFEPFLLDTILGRPPDQIGNYVGSSDEAPQGDDLHRVWIEGAGSKRPELIVVAVQLFADRGFAIHRIVVGRRNDATGSVKNDRDVAGA